MEEEEFRLKSGVRKRASTAPELPRENFSEADEYDEYVRDENGRPVDILRRGAGRRTRNAPAPQLNKFIILGTIFSGALLLSGQLIPGALVAGSTLFIVIVARLRR
ncbi:MAG: hypothetical protein QW074_03410 [Candidatus Caldarchaeum sp.]